MKKKLLKSLRKMYCKPAIQVVFLRTSQMLASSYNADTKAAETQNGGSFNARSFGSIWNDDDSDE